MQSQTQTKHRRQQGVRSLTQMLAFAMLALHAAQLTIPHVANAVQLVTSGAAQTDSDEEESAQTAKRVADVQAEAQLHNNPRSYPARGQSCSHDTAAATAHGLHTASIRMPAQARRGQLHDATQLVRLTI